ncbi:flagellar basal body rod protein FlgB [Hyphomicrobium facile]|uniref:Flagellar basal body rod protein FlgB n=1 Tax=Hyphomicrobium facile TaxID=51670 RepID=A0A1I7NRE2_9HYPH|nr:flagellar basal body rod protein FlgB [Hyphomicrobium facile]SFV37254.1 flagellar basal-body rod protein FlgB [Hyphomicrobium facile]
MQPMQLFNLAFRQNEWLAQRQSVISSNIANANTPGYKAKDVESFEDVMSKSVRMTVTDGQHMAPADIGNLRQQESGFGEAEVLVSGNDVNLEQEFLKSSEVVRSYTMNTQIMKTFDRMLQSVTKG